MGQAGEINADPDLQPCWYRFTPTPGSVGVSPAKLPLATLLVEQAGEGEETARLVDLAWSVEEELLLLGNELANLLQIDAY